MFELSPGVYVAWPSALQLRFPLLHFFLFVEKKNR